MCFAYFPHTAVSCALFPSIEWTSTHVQCARDAVIVRRSFARARGLDQATAELVLTLSSRARTEKRVRVPPSGVWTGSACNFTSPGVGLGWEEALRPEEALTVPRHSRAGRPGPPDRPRRAPIGRLGVRLGRSRAASYELYVYGTASYYDTCVIGSSSLEPSFLSRPSAIRVSVDPPPWA